MLDLTLKELKENIYIRAEESLCKLGFKGNKSKMQYLMKNKERIIFIEYDFNHYYPIDYQFIFGVIIKYPTLIDEVQNFFKTVDAVRPAQWNMFLRESDFIESLMGEAEINRDTYYNVVTSKQQSIEIINASLKTLIDKVLPFADSFPTLQQYQDFCINNLAYFKKNLDVDIITSILIASKMRSDEDYKKAFNDIEDFLTTEQKNGTYRGTELHYLSKLKSYLENRK